MSRLIVYACPTGELSLQVEAYSEETRRRFGPNAAHHYMPHVTLTGFFNDAPEAIPHYARWLEEALEHALPTRPDPVLDVTGRLQEPDFLCLTLASPWLRACIANFAERAASPTRTEALRLKEWLHLSLAYQFPPEQFNTLQGLAEAQVDPQAPVQWELRFYEQHAPKDRTAWSCHFSRLL